MEPYERLDNLKVASPCRAKWSEMTGDHTVRFCHACGLHVYNLSALKRKEAEALVSKKDGKLCVRFYRRADGSVLTQDCPIGLRAARLRLARLAGAMAAFLAAAGGGFWQRLLGDAFSRSAAPPPRAVMGDVAVEPAPLMGKIAAPPAEGQRG